MGRASDSCKNAKNSGHSNRDTSSESMPCNNGHKRSQRSDRAQLDNYKIPIIQVPSSSLCFRLLRSLQSFEPGQYRLPKPQCRSSHGNRLLAAVRGRRHLSDHQTLERQYFFSRIDDNVHSTIGHINAEEFIIEHIKISQKYSFRHCDESLYSQKSYSLR